MHEHVPISISTEPKEVSFSLQSIKRDLQSVLVEVILVCIGLSPRKGVRSSRQAGQGKVLDQDARAREVCSD